MNFLKIFIFQKYPAKLHIFLEKAMIFINFCAKMQKSLKKIWKFQLFFLIFAPSNENKS